MKKITSLVLVAMMLLAILPMCFMTATAASSETVGPYTFETVVVYDKGDPVAAAGSWQHQTDAAGNQIASSGKNAADAAGVLIDVKWTALAQDKTYAQFKFKFTDANGGDTGGYYFSKDGSKTGFFNDENWLRIAETAFDGTIFLPAADLSGWEKVNNDTVAKVSVALGNTADGTWDNVRLAYGKFVPKKIETVGASKLDTIAIYADSISTNTGNWAAYTTDLFGITSNGKTAKDAIGVLVDIKWTGATSTVKFKFQFDTNPRTESSNGGTNGYYFAKGETKLDYFGTNNWLEINKTDFEGTIFMPKEGFCNWDTTATFNNISTQSQGAADVAISNVRLAYGEFTPPTYADAPDGPTKLPDVNAEYTATNNLFGPERVVTPGDTSWSSASMVAEGTNDFITKDPYGVMFTIDATNAKQGAVLGVTFCLQVKWKDKDTGKTNQTYLSPTPYGASINTQTFTVDGTKTAATLAPLQGQCSTWYVSYDGTTWESFDVQRTLNDDGSTKTGGRYAELAVGGKTAVVYVPMSEFYTRDGETWLADADHKKGDDGKYVQDVCVDFKTFESIVGKEWYISLDKFFWGGELSSDKTNVKLSNFWVVACEHNWTKGTVVTPSTHTEYGWQNAHCEACKIDSIVAVEKTTEHEWPTTYTNLEDGTHGIVCGCGEKQVSEHVWGEASIVLPATHLTIGVSQQVCTAEGCGATKNEEIPALEAHEWTYEAIDDNEHKKTCICTEEVTEDHNWDAGTVTAEPTVEAEGSKLYTCADCGHTKTEAIAKLPAPAAADAEDDGGCGSVIGSGFAMMAILSGAAVVLTKKRRK